MKAIQINHYLKDARPILHSDVVQIDSRLPAYRSFLCRCCCRDWTEQTNAFAHMIEDEKVLNNLEEYYPNYELCSDRKVTDCKYRKPTTIICSATCDIGRYCFGVCDKFKRK